MKSNHFLSCKMTSHAKEQALPKKTMKLDILSMFAAKYNMVGVPLKLKMRLPEKLYNDEPPRPR